MTDAAFLRDFSDGFGLDDDNLIEIVCTRSNAELQVRYCTLEGRNVRCPCTYTALLFFYRMRWCIVEVTIKSHDHGFLI
jgi:Annexin